MAETPAFVERKDLYIGGEWVPSRSRTTIEVIGAATEQPLGRVPDASPADIDRAVAAARNAFDHGPFPDWTPAERGDALSRLSKALQARAPKIAETISRENGCPGADVDGPPGLLRDDGARHLRRDRAQLQLRRGAHRRASATGCACAARRSAWSPRSSRGTCRSSCRAEARPGAGGGLHGGAEARARDAARRLPAGRGDRRGRAAAGRRSTCCAAGRENSEYLVRHPGIDKV